MLLLVLNILDCFPGYQYSYIRIKGKTMTFRFFTFRPGAFYEYITREGFLVRSKLIAFGVIIFLYHFFSLVTGAPAGHYSFSQFLLSVASAAALPYLVYAFRDILAKADDMKTLAMSTFGLSVVYLFIMVAFSLIIRLGSFVFSALPEMISFPFFLLMGLNLFEDKEKLWPGFAAGFGAGVFAWNVFTGLVLAATTEETGFAIQTLLGYTLLEILIFSIPLALLYKYLAEKDLWAVIAGALNLATGNTRYLEDLGEPSTGAANLPDYEVTGYWAADIWREGAVFKVSRLINPVEFFAKGNFPYALSEDSNYVRAISAAKNPQELLKYHWTLIFLNHPDPNVKVKTLNAQISSGFLPVIREITYLLLGGNMMVKEAAARFIAKNSSAGIIDAVFNVLTNNYNGPRREVKRHEAEEAARDLRRYFSPGEGQYIDKKIAQLFTSGPDETDEKVKFVRRFTRSGTTCHCYMASSEQDALDFIKEFKISNHYEAVEVETPTGVIGRTLKETYRR